MKQRKSLAHFGYPLTKGETSLTQIAKDFEISQSCVKNWLKQAEIDDGHARRHP